MNRIFIRLYLKYFFYWITLFLVLRIAFLFIHYPFAENASARELFMSFMYALRHDMAIAGYIMVFYTFLIIAYLFFRESITRRILSIYTIIMLSVVLIISIVDAGLYGYWRYRIDSTVLDYIDTPKEMLASAGFGEYIKAILLFLAALYICFYVYKKIFKKDYDVVTTFKNKGRYKILLWISVLPILIVPIRGSLGVAAVNVGSVFFSQNIFCNHLAINPVLSFVHDVFERENLEHIPSFYTEQEAEDIFNDFVSHNNKSKSVLKVKNPNVILIILESFGYQTIERLGGKEGVAPNLNGLIDEGLFFQNFYASGQSSRKGLVAILSGYPAQPKSSIMGLERKTKQLPKMAGYFNDMGYESLFIYGGSLDFAHMNSFVFTVGFERVYSINNFLTESKKNKWGVHDEVTFNKLSELLANKENNPVFATFFTLSSHEPYDVPMKAKTELETNEDKYYHSVQYTDSCIGVFINDMKRDKNLWDSSLVIFVADHSTRIGNLPIFEKRSFHIPMLWVGGALDTTGIINKFGGQTDILNTLITQVKDTTVDNVFGKNLLDSLSMGYAFYTYNNGFALLKDKCSIYYDNNMGRLIGEDYKSDTIFADVTKAYYQCMITDYINK